MAYDVIYMLKPAYEDLAKGGPGWYKLRWRPIWRQTFSIYRDSVLGGSSWLRVRYLNWDERNGWHRSYKHRLLVFSILKIGFVAWVRWDFMVHKDGPSDLSPKRPLIFN